MPSPGDDINWTQQLGKLPTWMQGVIIWFRLLGMLAVLIMLVGIYIAKDLGIVSDSASRDRRALMSENKSQTEILLKNHELLRTQLELQAAHVDNTNTIARTLCFLIPKLSPQEQRECIKGVR